MISKVEINNIATFRSRQLIDGLKKFNYIFGANGTGKTTISRVIDAPDNYSSCSVTWNNQTPLETRVYNRNFVVRNFNQQKLKGVFTLGETAKETFDRITNTKEDITKLQNEINNLKATLQGIDGSGGKKAELAQLTQTYRTKFFTMKQKHADTLSGSHSGEGMRGFIRSQDSFMKKVLAESTSNTATLLTQAELEEKAKTIFSNTLMSVNPIPKMNMNEILQHETNPILKKRIIGKNDVDISAMIFKLNNSDWVRMGVSYYEANDAVCPFCQQTTIESFRKSLYEYFDETFIQDSNAIRTLIENYSADTRRLQNQLQALIDSQLTFLDIERLKSEKHLLDSIITINKQRLLEKQKESSQVVTLDSHGNAFANISKLIEEANANIYENNRIFCNLRNEKTILTSQIWKFVISELAADIEEYNQKKTSLNNAIDNIHAQIVLKNAEKARKEAALHELEKQTTSIVPTRDGINHLLNMFGFKSFKLDLGDEPNTYKLVREDGSDAKNTLSEGEKNFLTFLYFFHLIKGSQNEVDIDNEKVVVIDDPIASLDQNILFIVSTLIRDMIQDVRENKGSIKQVFILTHNIYFHKEVTFNKKRNSDALSEETFWLVTKNGKVSTIEKQLSNPIKTSYELLWEEVRNHTRNSVTIQNSLRRILESYFKLLGGIHLDDLYKKFDGEDKVKCKALCSWINDGLHRSFDDEDFYTPLDAAMIQKFLNVFKQIFQKTGHIAHYNMMMGIDSVIENI